MQEQNGVLHEPESKSTFSCNVSLDNTSSTLMLAMIEGVVPKILRLLIGLALLYTGAVLLSRSQGQLPSVK